MSSISENISLDELTYILNSKNKNSVVETDYFLRFVLSIKFKVLYSNLSEFKIKDRFFKRLIEVE
ncbi:MAG: hypothetical protein PUA90_05655 [bacterium]|nr:hypothetical protein [bacterium]